MRTLKKLCGSLAIALLMVVFEAAACHILLKDGRDLNWLLNELHWSMIVFGAMLYGLGLLWNQFENVWRLSTQRSTELDDEDGWFSRTPSVFCLLLSALATWIRPETAVLLPLAFLCMGLSFVLFAAPQSQCEEVPQEASDTEVMAEPSFAM